VRLPLNLTLLFATAVAEQRCRMTGHGVVGGVGSAGASKLLLYRCMRKPTSSQDALVACLSGAGAATVAGAARKGMVAIRADDALRACWAPGAGAGGQRHRKGALAPAAGCRCFKHDVQTAPRL